MNDAHPKPPQPQPSPTLSSGGGTAILLMGFVILLCSCALILAVRIHARLDGVTKALEELVISTKEKNAVLANQIDLLRKQLGEKPAAAATTTKDGGPAKTNTVIDTSTKRSPIPQPGETITKPLPATKIGEVDPAKPIAPEPAAGEIVPWDKAHLHMGRTITVEGKIVNTRRQETICFLNFSEEGSTSPFYMVVFKAQFDEYGGAPEKFFLNKKVRVTGLVEEHRGRSQIKINKKEQVLSVE